MWGQGPALLGVSFPSTSSHSFSRACLEVLGSWEQEARRCLGRLVGLGRLVLQGKKPPDLQGAGRRVRKEFSSLPSSSGQNGIFLVGPVLTPS